MEIVIAWVLTSAICHKTVGAPMCVVHIVNTFETEKDCEVSRRRQMDFWKKRKSDNDLSVECVKSSLVKE